EMISSSAESPMVFITPTTHNGLKLIGGSEKFYQVDEKLLKDPTLADWIRHYEIYLRTRVADSPTYRAALADLAEVYILTGDLNNLFKARDYIEKCIQSATLAKDQKSIGRAYMLRILLTITVSKRPEPNVRGIAYNY